MKPAHKKSLLSPVMEYGGGHAEAKDAAPKQDTAGTKPARRSLSEVLRASWRQNEAGYRYLAR